MTQPRNLPPSLAPPASPPSTPDPAEPDTVVFYLAVPDTRFIPALKHKARLFSSARTDIQVELRVFHAPNLPNVPLDQLQLLGTLSELGEVKDLDITTIRPERLP